ncbi:COP9 signalosome complex subunit 4 [Verticillium alfalfae VaMs.102]|uniref:COP9 signalosome complex subunit 4 n=1 Tax=Verticillium alfalfae (strain VaMs.102 / ATCC MYA-4576 / FGSC 10136) TaxID=526221 RepID=C9SIC7_VERA1|nr:COP9 signalosome complex subunit 4 [Verticillium alfalfae VaMs.102]EEY18700.1 COP9 signalosome complex subunit 4 [Verticillium alfalfae VaMs.102]
MATAHEANEDFLEAAKCLAEMPLDSSQRKVSPADRARVWIRIARNYLEVDDTTAAETYVNKLKNIMHDVADEKPHDARDLDLHFRLSQARVYDAKRDFLNAGARYHDISLSPAIAEDERLHTLSMAVKCAILAPAGPMRARTLGRLYKDERAAALDESTSSPRACSPTSSPPRPTAPPSSRAPSSSTTSSAPRASTPTLASDALGVLLGLDADKAEETTARMIEQGRLVGRIDQMDRIIWFERGEASGQKGSGRAEVVVGKEMRQWDANIQSVAEEVENVTNALQKEFPDFVAKNLLV